MQGHSFIDSFIADIYIGHDDDNDNDVEDDDVNDGCKDYAKIIITTATTLKESLVVHLGDAAGVCFRTNHNRWNHLCDPVVGTR